MENNKKTTQRCINQSDLRKLSETFAKCDLNTMPKEEVEIAPGACITVYPLNDLLEESLSQEEVKETE